MGRARSSFGVSLFYAGVDADHSHSAFRATEVQPRGGRTDPKFARLVQMN